jgi:hypothetical protein
MPVPLALISSSLVALTFSAHAQKPHFAFTDRSGA